MVSRFDGLLWNVSDQAEERRDGDSGETQRGFCLDVAAGLLCTQCVSDMMSHL